MSASFESFRSLFAPADEQLMWRVQTRDDAGAFAELVKRWQEPTRRLCARITGDLHRAEDLAQEVFAKIFARRQAYAVDRSFAAWIRRVTLNHCFNELRRSRARPETLMPVSEADEESPSMADFTAPQPGPDSEAADREQGEAVRFALQALPEHYRTVLVLRHYEGLKYREIAEVLDLPEGTVKTRMTEALNEMARLLRHSLNLPIAPPVNRRGRRPELLML